MSTGHVTVLPAHEINDDYPSAREVHEEAPDLNDEDEDKDDQKEMLQQNWLLLAFQFETPSRMAGGENMNAHRTRLQPNHRQTGESRISVQDLLDGEPLMVLRLGERAGSVSRNITIKLCII